MVPGSSNEVSIVRAVERSPAWSAGGSAGRGARERAKLAGIGMILVWAAGSTLSRSGADGPPSAAGGGAPNADGMRRGCVGSRSSGMESPAGRGMITVGAFADDGTRVPVPVVGRRSIERGPVSDSPSSGSMTCVSGRFSSGSLSTGGAADRGGVAGGVGPLGRESPSPVNRGVDGGARGAPGSKARGPDASERERAWTRVAESDRTALSVGRSEGFSGLLSELLSGPASGPRSGLLPAGRAAGHSSERSRGRSSIRSDQFSKRSGTCRAGSIIVRPLDSRFRISQPSSSSSGGGQMSVFG